MFSNDQILTALKKVIHPEKGKDIVTLGMVSEIVSGEDGISLVVEPEKSNDPFISSVKSTIVKSLKEAFGPDTVISDIKVRLKLIVGKQQVRSDNFLPGVQNIIAVSSGKGGVGKTTVAVNLAEKMGVSLLGQIPIVQSKCESSNKGHPVALED